MRASFSSVAFALSVTAVLLVANHAAAQAPQPSIAPPPPGFTPAPPATAPGPPPGFAPVAPPPPGAAPYPQQPPIVYYPAPSPGLAPGATAQPAPPPPPAIMRYEEGDPIPAGYHLESRARMNIVGTGIGLFVPFYAISTLSAAIAEAGGNSNYWPMYIPTIGPVIAISTAKPENNFATFMLGLDTAAQTAGIGLIIWGMVAREKRLIRIADSLPALELAPLHFGRGSVGLGISGSL